MASPDRLRLRVDFVDDGVFAVAELDARNAELTAAGIVRALPISGKAFHGIYSGSEVACLIPPEIRIPPGERHFAGPPRRHWLLPDPRG